MVSSGTGSRPRSIPTKRRIDSESYSASSTAGSDRLNQQEIDAMQTAMAAARDATPPLLETKFEPSPGQFNIISVASSADRPSFNRESQETISRRAGEAHVPRDDDQQLERLMTVDQLAEIWQLHPRTIRRMIADGRIPVQRFGRSVLIHPKVARRTE